MTPHQAAVELGVSVWTVTRWCRTGYLAEAIKPGRKWKVPEHSVRDLLQPVTAKAA